MRRSARTRQIGASTVALTRLASAGLVAADTPAERAPLVLVGDEGFWFPVDSAFFVARCSCDHLAISSAFLRFMPAVAPTVDVAAAAAVATGAGDSPLNASLSLLAAIELPAMVPNASGFFFSFLLSVKLKAPTMPLPLAALVVVAEAVCRAAPLDAEYDASSTGIGGANGLNVASAPFAPSRQSKYSPLNEL